MTLAHHPTRNARAENARYQNPQPQNPQPQSRDEFHDRLRRIGAERYHDRHPFHKRLHGGQCSPDEVRAWVINRWQYQSRIPMKDAAFMSRLDDPHLRRIWRSRIEDHDGGVDQGGGIRRWLVLARAVGLDPDYVASGVGVMPATRFAVDAYLRFVRDMPLLDAVAASLTEMFAPRIHAERIAGLLAHYDFADEASLAYFRNRLTEAPKDVAFGLNHVLDHADTLEKQDAAAAALCFKTDVLWAQLDALWHGYVEGRIPPGAWQPGEGLRVAAPDMAPDMAPDVDPAMTCSRSSTAACPDPACPDPACPDPAWPDRK